MFDRYPVITVTATAISLDFLVNYLVDEGVFFVLENHEISVLMFLCSIFLAIIFLINLNPSGAKPKRRHKK